MIQNIYDDPEFFEGYMRIRRSPVNANALVEQPGLWDLLPDLQGKRMLDLGCGTGEACMEYIRHGAESVKAIDISGKMIREAQARNSNDRISYQIESIEQYEYPLLSYDCVVSSLALQYVEDFKPVVRGVYRSLVKNGTFLFSQEHPVITSTQESAGWIRDSLGRKQHWKLDNDFDEGVRISDWIIKGVRKYHRTIQSIVNAAIDAGLLIERIVEPSVTAETAGLYPHFTDERRVPTFLIMKCRKD